VAEDHEEVKAVAPDEPARPAGELKPDLEPVEQEQGQEQEQEEVVEEENEEPEQIDGGEN
jgi:hypothetical protein